MDEIAKLRAEIAEYQRRLRDESLLRSELERRCALLEKLAHRDPSTGLRTESYLHARVREEIDRAIRFPAATSLVTMCSPDHVTESLGHLGQRLTDELRATDQVFKLGKDALAILLVETPADGAHHVIERLSAELEHVLRGSGYTVTSFPVDANLAEDFLKLALDRHREMAKRFGPDTAFSSPQRSN